MSEWPSGGPPVTRGRCKSVCALLSQQAAGHGVAAVAASARLLPACRSSVCMRLSTARLLLRQLSLLVRESARPVRRQVVEPPQAVQGAAGAALSTGGSAKCSEAESADEWRLAYSPLAAQRHGRLPLSRADFSSPWAARLAVTLPSHSSLANDFPFHTRSCVSPF